MAEPGRPTEQQQPARRLLPGILIAVTAAVLLLVVVVLPAEFGIDPTGAGRALGLTALNEPTPAAQAAQIKDVIGGNEKLDASKVPDVGQPIPLPNPAVSQIKAAAAKTHTQTVTLPPNGETEVKMVLDVAQVSLYSWEADGDLYVDFHGHDPVTMGRGFVRYEEQQATRSGHGSLVAPFKGEHGWYWLNDTDNTVNIKLTVTGYFDSIKDYGLFKPKPVPAP